jgi:hypothetical protein
VCILVLRLSDHPVAATVLNFGREDVTENVHLEIAGRDFSDSRTDVASRESADTSVGGHLAIRIPAVRGTILVPAQRP